ncbi:hypothetical protein CVIRNUC_010601 [Coccomyxa viridis]|uniref:Uncharacterized protein n=1 Tax=Coccomyxa viridis TaxID=1274662 RepID=A0AAV1IJ82_9CHLO|nr:hypothetical protein CVIRNUC_010601 [Coccomyxa viridis]
MPPDGNIDCTGRQEKNLCTYGLQLALRELCLLLTHWATCAFGCKSIPSSDSRCTDINTTLTTSQSSL